MFTVNANVIVNTIDESARDRVTALELEVQRLQAKDLELMAASKDVLDFCTRLDTATDEIAKDLADLRNSTDLSAEAKAKMKGLEDRLTALGKDPVNPVPPSA